MSRFDEVVTVYWKEQPHFRDVHAQTTARNLLIVPIMTASGYYTNTVLPREIGFGAPSPGRSVHIARPIGELPGMTEIVVEQGIAAATEAGIEPREAHLLLIGHGTRRDPVRSGATTHRHVVEIANRAIFLSAAAGFLDQDPEVAPAFDAVGGREPIIIVPFLIANGGHGADDIPRAIGTEPGSRIASVDGRAVLFADAVGEHPRIVHLILQAAEETTTSRTRVA